MVASIELLEEKGFDLFTVQEVSQRADVSAGAIYARFGTKESLLRAVHRHALDLIRPQQDLSALAVGPAHEVIANTVRAVAGIFRENQNLLRAFMHLGALDDEISRHASDNSRELARQFAGTVLAHRDEITHRDPEQAVDVAFRMAFSTFARRVMSGPTFETPRMIDWDELIEEVGDACASYLLTERPTTRPRRRSTS